MIETLHRLDFGMILLLEWSLELCNEWMGIGCVFWGGIAQLAFVELFFARVAYMTLKRWLQTDSTISSHLFIGLRPFLYPL